MRAAAASVAAAAALAIAVSGCAAPQTAPGGSGHEIVAIQAPEPTDWQPEPGPRPEVSADLVARMNDLGMDLWQTLRAQQPEQDVWVSPVSVYQALSLLAPGAGPEAVGELLAAMGLTDGEVGANTAQLADWITASRRSDYLMALYNAAFASQEYGGFAPGYLDAIEPVRDEVGGFDALDPQGSADRINGRVAAHTRQQIEEILAPADITPDLAFVLLNATAFKGAWVSPFDPVFTSERDFTLLDGAVVPVDTMWQLVPLAVAAGDGYTAATLPYQGGAAAVIVLPDEGRFSEVAAGLTAAEFARIAGATASQDDYDVALPKFTSDSGITELVPALQAAGVSEVFTGTPDWPMFGNADEQRIGFVKHRVVVAVNELGTEAAAATAVGGIGGAGPEYAFTVNRPFVMAVLDADGAVLFLGQVTDPR